MRPTRLPGIARTNLPDHAMRHEISLNRFHVLGKAPVGVGLVAGEEEDA
jgi:hypothetical protein